MRDFLRRLLLYDPNRDSQTETDVSDSEPDDDDGGSEPSERAYLEFVEGSSAKFYALVIVGLDDGTWGVAFNFGRIGYPREWGRKATGVARAKAQDVFDATRYEKLRGGYKERLWPGDFELPEGAVGPGSGASSGEPEPTAGIYRSTVIGKLPSSEGESVAGVALPAGRLVASEAMPGVASGPPVLWISERPMNGIERTWARLADAFAQTGLWPLIIDEEGAAVMDDRLYPYEPAKRRDPAPRSYSVARRVLPAPARGTASRAVHTYRCRIPSSSSSGRLWFQHSVASHFDDETGKFVTSVFERADALLLGRKTWEIFERYWPHHEGGDPVSHGINVLPKYVPSTTLKDPGWNTHVIADDVEAAVRELKAKPGRELQVHGSGELLRWLLERDLVDELYLEIHPVVVGEGNRLFPERGQTHNLELVESRSTPSGVTLQTYRPAGRATFATVEE